MIYRNEPPRSLRDLERSVKDLPRKTKFEVLEVNTTRDRLKTNLTFDRYLRKGTFTIVFIEGDPK